MWFKIVKCLGGNYLLHQKLLKILCSTSPCELRIQRVKVSIFTVFILSSECWWEAPCDTHPGHFPPFCFEVPFSLIPRSPIPTVHSLGGSSGFFSNWAVSPVAPARTSLLRCLPSGFPFMSHNLADHWTGSPAGQSDI